MEDNYNDLQAQIEAQRAQHAETIALLSTRMDEAKKQNNDMSDRVSMHSMIMIENKVAKIKKIKQSPKDRVEPKVSRLPSCGKG